MAEQAALAHLQLARQAADRQPLQPLGGGQVDRPLEDRLAPSGAAAGFAVVVAIASQHSLQTSTNVRAGDWLISFPRRTELEETDGRLRGEENRRDGGGLRRRLQARAGRARRRVVRPAGDRHAAERDQYPEHDHAEDGQEEVYLALAARARSRSTASATRSTRDTMVRVSSGTKRKVCDRRGGRCAC